MLDQPPPPERNENSGTGSGPRSPDPLQGAAAPGARIEDYLDQVYAPLVNQVPFARRQELRTELRGDLEALAATYQELGSGPEVAVEQALRQFGDPRELARQCIEEWRRAAPGRSRPPIWPAVLIALGCFGFQQPLFTTLGMVLHAAGLQAGGWWMLAAAIFGVILTGLVAGLAAPARPVKGALLALALLSLPPALQSLIVWAHSSAWEIPMHGWLWGARQILIHAIWRWLEGNLFMMPLGAAGATLGSRLRARLAQRPGRWVVQ